MTEDRNAAVERLLESAGRDWAAETAASEKFRGRLSESLRAERRAAAPARILGMPRTLALRAAAVLLVAIGAAAFFAAFSGRESMVVAWTDGTVQFAARTLANGGTLSTGADGRAVAVLDDGRVQVMLARGTTLHVAGEDRLRLEAGEVWVSVEAKSGFFEVATPDARVVVRGTRFGVRHDAAGTTVLLEEGTVEVEAGGTARTLQSGASAVVAPGGGLAVSSPSAAAMPDWAEAVLADWHRSAAAQRWPSGWSAEANR